MIDMFSRGVVSQATKLRVITRFERSQHQVAAIGNKRLLANEGTAVNVYMWNPTCGLPAQQLANARHAGPHTAETPVRIYVYISSAAHG